MRRWSRPPESRRAAHPIGRVPCGAGGLLGQADLARGQRVGDLLSRLFVDGDEVEGAEIEAAAMLGVDAVAAAGLGGEPDVSVADVAVERGVGIGVAQGDLVL